MSDDVHWHPLLARQARDSGHDDLRRAPSQEAWDALVTHLNRTYNESDASRGLLERSLAHSSEELREVNEDLSAERDKLDAILHALGAGVLYLNVDWEVVFANETAEQMLAGGASLVGMALESLWVTIDTAGRQVRPSPVLIANQMAHSREGTFVQDGILTGFRGAPFAARWSASPMLQRDGLAGAVIRIEDVSTLVAAKSEAQAARQEAEAQAFFLARMSHELRTPLSAIIGYAELVLEDAIELGATSLRDDLGRIHQASQHLLSLINDVLDYSRIQAGQMELDLAPADIAELVDQVVASTQAVVQKKGNRMVVDVDAGVGQMVTDPTKVRQALINLLGNAAKFTEQGTITLHAARQGEWVLFEVRDTGIGIEEELIEGLFTPFTQAHHTTHRRYGGTGLGLTISRHICQLLGGDIEVDSVLGQGSIFRVRLPDRRGEG